MSTTLQLDIGPPHKQTQRVWTGSRISYLLVLNNGVPQGHVLSPLLFTLQTHDCTPWHQNISIVRKGRWHHHHWPHYKQWCELLTLTLSLQLECLESSLQSPKDNIATVCSPCCHLEKDTEVPAAIPVDFRAASFLRFLNSSSTLNFYKIKWTQT